MESETETEIIPANAVWFDKDEFRRMVAGWLESYDGVRYARDAMDLAHGSWTADG